MNLGDGHPQPSEEVADGTCRHGGDRQVLEEGDSPKQTSGRGQEAPVVRRAVGESHPQRSRGRRGGRQ